VAKKSLAHSFGRSYIQIDTCEFDKIKTMKRSGLSGQKVAKNILSLVLIIFPFWNLVGGSIPSANQQEQDTETASPDVTGTAQPSEPPSLQVTETATLIPESPTAALPSSTVTEVPAIDMPMSDENLSGEFASDEVLAHFRDQASRESIERCIQSVNASIISDIDELNTFVLSVPPGGVAESIFHLESCPGLRYAEPNYLAQIADTIPSDPGWRDQYGLKNIRAPQGWEITTGSSSVTIAIIDTGIDYSHLDLAGKIVGGIDIVNGDNNPQDDNGHGTHVAGIAGAVSDNGLGVAGVSWGARLMPVKVLNAAGRGGYADVAEGIIWAADHGAQIINLSLGGDQPSQTLQDAVDYAASQGIVIVAASGNTGRNFVLYPARYPNVIAVAATDSSNARAGISHYGPELDLSAPGISIYSTAPGGYGYRSGTSMAAAFVSGLAAILRGVPGNGSPAAITQQMENTALDLGATGRDDFYGYGLIQMDAAIQLVWQTATPTSISPTPISPTPVPSTSLPARSFSSLPEGFAFMPTFTLTVTETSTPIQTETFTPSPASVSAGVPMVTEPAEVIALQTDMPAVLERDTNLFQPCLGLFLITLGIVLFWMANLNRKRNRIRLIHFR